MVKRRKPRFSKTRLQSTVRPLTEQAPGELSRGEVWLVALDPTIGSEIQKTRPCLIVSPAEMHNYLRTAIAAPMTTSGSSAPFRVPVRFGGRKGLILLDQIRMLDKRWLIRCLGAIDPATLRMTLLRLQECFAE